MLNALMTQKLKLVKKGSNKIFKDIPANVQDKIFINDIKLPIEEGDMFEYKLPSGLKQKLLIVKVTLYNMNSPLDHYEIEYVKE